MANCNGLFQNFNAAIRLGDTQREMLRGTRDNLRGHILTQFQVKYPEYKPEFLSQGSYVMDTIIVPENNDFDIDDGMYFIDGRPADKRPHPKDVHEWVMQTIGRYSHFKEKATCIRVIFEKEGFHVDVPIYFTNNYSSPNLAHKEKGWLLSNPVEFIAWFEAKIKSGFDPAFFYSRAENLEKYKGWRADIRKNDAQLRRLVRYMKAWGDLKRAEMPSGIIMTILTAENYCGHERDDVALRDTLISIQGWLKRNDCSCPRPTTPVNEDLFLAYTPEQKRYFLSALTSFIGDANDATATYSENVASIKWRNHLGKRFPFVPEPKKELTREELTPLIKVAQPSTPWLNG